MKDVLVVVSPTSGDQLSAGADYAVDLARVQAAHLSVLIEEIEADRLGASPEPDNMQADHTIIEPISLPERLARMKELIRAATKLANVPCEIIERHEFASLREGLIYLAQARDVLIVDVDGPLEPPRKDLVDGALFGSGRPVILVPQGTRKFAADRIVIAWDETRSAVRAIHDALPLLVHARDVSILSVADDKAFLAPNTGSLLCGYLARWNVAARFSAVKRDNQNVGAALLAYARRSGSDLLVMGAFAHGPEREFMLGSATKDVFHTNLEMPVFLSH